MVRPPQPMVPPIDYPRNDHMYDKPQFDESKFDFDNDANYAVPFGCKFIRRVFNDISESNESSFSVRPPTQNFD
jgi:hypothetical protein